MATEESKIGKTRTGNLVVLVVGSVVVICARGLFLMRVVLLLGWLLLM